MSNVFKGSLVECFDFFEKHGLCCERNTLSWLGSAKMGFLEKENETWVAAIWESPSAALPSAVESRNDALLAYIDAYK